MGQEEKEEREEKDIPDGKCSPRTVIGLSFSLGPHVISLSPPRPRW